MGRIPKYENPRQWLTAMHELDLLFHPDDDPSEILGSGTDEMLFTDNEANEVRGIMERLFNDCFEECLDPYAICVDLINN